MISTFARESGLSVDTVRFYVRRELLHPEIGQKGGSRPYQMFSTANLEKARSIRIGQALGLSLEEISSLLKVQALDNNSKLLAFLADQRGRLARKVADLQKLVSFLDARMAGSTIPTAMLRRHFPFEHSGSSSLLAFFRYDTAYLLPGCLA